MEHDFSPKIDVSIDENTGIVRTAYCRIRSGEVADTREVLEGRAFADYDAKGFLLGVEILAPCKVEILDRLVECESEPIKRFMRGSPPKELLLASS